MVVVFFLACESQEPKKTWNGKVQASVRTNNSEQSEDATDEMWGFVAKMARKFTRTSP